MACPLCQASGDSPREEISPPRICELYREFFGIEVRRLFRDTASVGFAECAACGLRYFSPMVTGDGGFYDELQKQPWYYLESKYEYDFVADMIAPGARVLDIGAGKGAFADRLVSGVQYTGLDSSIEARRKAQSKGVEVIDESIEAHALSHREGYDFVVSFQSLEHVADPRAFLMEAAACIRPSGKLVIVVPSDDSFLRFAANAPLNMPPHHVTRWPDRTLREIAKLLGLKLSIVHHEPLQDIHSEWAFSVMAGAILGRGKRLVERHDSVFAKVISRMSGILGGVLSRRLPREFWPCGHSVIAVYTK